MIPSHCRAKLRNAHSNNNQQTITRKRHRFITEEGNAMTVTTTMAVGPMSEVDHQSALRRAVIASTVGTTIEWYDFLIYSTVTGLVFNKVYFPGSDPWIGTLQAFGVYFIGFVAPDRSCDLRPLW
jgi:hypothetical protein